MRPELARLKIEALLHDPPGKAPLLWYRSHEGLARELVETALGDGPRHEEVVARADRYASAVDRVVPRGVADDRADFLRDPQIVHPLSGTRYDLRTLATLDLGEVEANQRAAVRVLVARAGGRGETPEPLYWWLWRHLGTTLLDRGDVGRLWTYLPADTRVPDHSIWDHMRLTSAFAGAMGTDGGDVALLLFSFGPIQSFVAAARRTGDLWAGSFLLSWLAWKAMEGLVAEWGADAVLFPDLAGQPLVDRWLREAHDVEVRAPGRRGRIASLPNRFLALVPASAGVRLGQAAERAVRQTHSEFAEGRVAELIQEHGLPAATRTTWCAAAARQAEETLICHWHVLPWLADDGALRQTSEAVLGEGIAEFWTTRDALMHAEQYRANRGTYFAVHAQLAEAGHAVARTLRRFEQIAEEGARCTVCGEREALWRLDVGVRPRAGRGIRAGERLCGVCAARREAPRSEWARLTIGEAVLFPSTHNLAGARFLESVLDVLARADAGELSQTERLLAARTAELVTALEGADRVYATPDLMRRARGCGLHGDLAEALVKLPGELLLRETYVGTTGASRLDELEEFDLPPARRPGARAAVTQFLAACRRAGLGTPGRYYAVLVMDGDHMGQWLSGRLAPAIAEVLHEAAQPAGTPSYLDRRRPLSSAHQAAVSRALNQFSLEIVGRVVEDVHGGVVVYAGGDDVLAMLPLHTLLPCLRDLRRLYSGLPLPEDSPARGAGFEAARGHVRWRGELWRVMGERATCSMGIAIAHQKWPLRYALTTAREMERHAKALLGRNAVAIALLKRSGAHEWFGVRWGSGAEVAERDPLRVLQDVARAIQEGRVSRRFAYALREEARVLWPLKDALGERATWLIRHHALRGQAAAGTLDRLGADLRWVAETLQQHGGLDDGHGAVAGSTPLERFVAALGIAEFIGRGGRDDTA